MVPDANKLSRIRVTNYMMKFQIFNEINFVVIRKITKFAKFVALQKERPVVCHDSAQDTVLWVPSTLPPVATYCFFHSAVSVN